MAGPSRFFRRGDFVPADLPARFDDCADAGPASGAEIVELTLRRFQSEDVGLGQIADVNVVADTGAVGRVVIGSVNFDVRLLSERNLQDIRDQVRLDAMFLAEPLRTAGGIEITERDKAQPLKL